MVDVGYKEGISKHVLIKRMTVGIGAPAPRF
jgi:hypothetical protein